MLRDHLFRVPKVHSLWGSPVLGDFLSYETILFLSLEQSLNTGSTMPKDIFHGNYCTMCQVNDIDCNCELKFKRGSW